MMLMLSISSKVLNEAVWNSPETGATNVTHSSKESELWLGIMIGDDANDHKNNRYSPSPINHKHSTFNWVWIIGGFFLPSSQSAALGWSFQAGRPLNPTALATTLHIIPTWMEIQISFLIISLFNFFEFINSIRLCKRDHNIYVYVQIRVVNGCGVNNPKKPRQIYFFWVVQSQSEYMNIMKLNCK